MSIERVAAIYRKDLRDAMRDSRLVMALVMPILLGLLYSFMFEDDARPSTSLGVVLGAPSRLPDEIVAAAEQSTAVDVVTVRDATTLEARVDSEELDVGLIVPAGFDADLAGGRVPQVTVIVPATPSYGGGYVAAVVDRVTQSMARQHPPATINRVVLPEKKGSTAAAVTALGTRRIFVLVAIILMLGMIAAYALPAIVTEETEKRTMEALLLVASRAEVVAAKAGYGLTYCVLSVPIMLAVTRTLPANVPAFAAALGVSSIALTGLGLLLGGMFRTQTQLNTWSGLIILPLLAPSITVGLPTPSYVNAILFVLPTSHTMRLGVNAFAGEVVFERAWLSYLILFGWAALAYALVWWRLSRDEAS